MPISIDVKPVQGGGYELSASGSIVLVQQSSPIITPPVIVGGGQLVHGQPFTVTGSGFGAKSRSNTWLLSDKGTDAVGSISSQYDSFSPNNSGQYAPYNILNQGTNFTPNSMNFGTPHPYLGAGGILAGANAIPFGSGDYQIWAGKSFVLPTLPCVFYARWRHRCDSSWAFGIGSPVDYNFKTYDYSSQSAPATGNNWYVSFHSLGARRSIM